MPAWMNTNVTTSLLTALPIAMVYTVVVALGSSISSFTCTACTLIILLHFSASTPTTSPAVAFPTLYTTPFAFCASYQTSKCKILLPMPAWINSDMTTSFLTALLPIAMATFLALSPVIKQ
ncbi:hypothetical protein V8E54_006958 [Elaphomyces granulatus]